MDAPEDLAADSASAWEVAAELAIVRADLAEVEALEDEVTHRAARLRARLPRGQARLVWELLDAEERLGQAERLLAIRRLSSELVRALPDHAATIEAAAGRLLGEGTEVGEVA